MTGLILGLDAVPLTPGQRFHRLTVLKAAGDRLWACACDCTATRICSTDDLVSKRARSCGCIVVLALDVATNTGWAAYNLDRSPSSILTGCFHCDSEGKGPAGRLQKRDDMRRKLRAVIKAHRPDVACLEAPLQVIETYGKRKAAPRRGDLLEGVSAHSDEEAGGGGPNASTVLLLNQLYAVAWDVCRGTIGGEVYEVPSGTWQTLIRSYAHAGGTKARSIEACRVLKIVLPGAKAQKDNAADAAMIAVWAKGHLQELKLMQRVAEAASAQSREGVAA